MNLVLDLLRAETSEIINKIKRALVWKKNAAIQDLYMRAQCTALEMEQ